MENLFDAVDHLRNRLGTFYWILRHDGDRELAAEQLRGAIALAAAQASQFSYALSVSLFQQWGLQQLHTLLRTARQALERLGLESKEASRAYKESVPMTL
jgi:hypothetical protein